MKAFQGRIDAYAAQAADDGRCGFPRHEKVERHGKGRFDACTCPEGGIDLACPLVTLHRDAVREVYDKPPAENPGAKVIDWVFPCDADLQSAIDDAKAKHDGDRTEAERALADLPDPTDTKGPPDWAPSQ